MQHKEVFYSHKQTNAKSESTHPALPASLTCIVGESPVVCVEQKPSLLPGFHPPSSFGQEACAASRCHPQVRAAGHAVTQRLHMGPEVKVCREEERQAPLLEEQQEFKMCLKIISFPWKLLLPFSGILQQMQLFLTLNRSSLSDDEI